MTHSDTQNINSTALADALKGTGDALPLMEDMVRPLKEGKPVPSSWLAERFTSWRHDIEVVIKGAKSCDKTKRELVHLVLQMAAQIEKLAGDDVCAQALCVEARDYVRSTGLEPAPVKVREGVDVTAEHAKDSEIVTLKGEPRREPFPRLRAMADVCGITIGRRDGGPYPTIEQLARFAALATGAELQAQPV